MKRKFKVSRVFHTKLKKEAIELMAALVHCPISMIEGEFDVQELTSITAPDQVLSFLKCLEEERSEVLVLIGMNIKNVVQFHKEIIRGGLNSMIITPLDILVPLFKNDCCNFIIAHNHPSGDPSPSEEDVSFTTRVKKAAKTAGLTLLDHIIVGRDGYFSFKEQELL